MGSVEPYAVGHYVAEANLPIDPSRSTGSFAPDRWERMQALRTALDPSGVFHTFLGLE